MKFFFWKITRPFRILWKYICAVFSYAKFLWKRHHDWDHSYILQLLQFKLKRMEKHFRSKCCMIENGPKYADDMRVAIEQIDKIIENDFLKKEWDEHIKKWGDIKFVKVGNGKYEMKTEKVKTKEDEEQHRKEVFALADLEEKMIQQAYDDLFAYLAKNIRNWWD